MPAFKAHNPGCACTSCTPPPPPPCGQICWIFKACGKPIIGATVNVTGPGGFTGTCTTGSNPPGMCCIAIPSAGTYNYTISASGYTGVIGSVTVPCSATLTTTITVTTVPSGSAECGPTTCCGGPFDTSTGLIFTDGTNTASLSHFTPGFAGDAPYGLGAFFNTANPGRICDSAQGWWGSFTATPIAATWINLGGAFPRERWYLLEQGTFSVSGCVGPYPTHGPTTFVVCYLECICAAILWNPVCACPGGFANLPIDAGNPNVLANGFYVPAFIFGGTCNPINCAGNFTAQLNANPNLITQGGVPAGLYCTDPASYLIWLLYPSGSVSVHVTP